MSFVFTLEDLAGKALSELETASAKRFAVPLRSIGTSGFEVPLYHDQADFLLGGDALLRVEEYDDDFLRDGTKTLHAHHRLITADEVASEDKASIACTFSDPAWVLFRRLCGKSKLGYSRGTAAVPVDRGLTIITELVNATNAESPSGVRMGNVTASSLTYVAGWYYKKIAEAIAELAAPLDGPDWRVRPILWAASGVANRGYYGELDVAPSIGTVAAGAHFQYGNGRLNVRGYKRGVSLEGSANRVFHLPPGFPDNATQDPMLEEAGDGIVAQAARELLEDVVNADLSVDGLRRALLQQHIATRSDPRQVITFNVGRALGSRVPRLGRDFNVGDVVPFQAYEVDSGLDVDEALPRIDVLTRVYQAEVAVDELGVGQPTLTTVPT